MLIPGSEDHLRSPRRQRTTRAVQGLVAQSGERGKLPLLVVGGHAGGYREIPFGTDAAPPLRQFVPLVPRRTLASPKTVNCLLERADTCAMTNAAADQLPRSARRSGRQTRPGVPKIWMIAAAVVLVAGGVGAGLYFGSSDDSSKSATTSAASALAAGLQAEVQGDTAKATTKFREVVAIDPANKLAYYNLGLIEQTAKDLIAAEADYRKTIAIDPKYAPALYNLGIIVSDAGNKTEAIDLYRRATVSDPKFAKAFLNLGLLLSDTGDKGASALALATAIQLDPTLRSRIPVTEQPAA